MGTVPRWMRTSEELDSLPDIQIPFPAMLMILQLEAICNITSTAEKSYEYL
jgi:hypothetical protein